MLHLVWSSCCSEMASAALSGTVTQSVAICIWQELIYVWNGFNILSKKPSLLEAMLVVVEQTVNTILEDKGTAY